MTTGKLTRKERDRQRREDDFLDAAEKLYAERGYFQTSMEDVAREAEYATGTIYRYFSSKEDLYNKILTRKGYAYVDKITPMLDAAESPLEKLKAIVRNKVDFFIQNAEFMRIYLNVVNAASDRMTPPEDLREVHARYVELVGGIFRDGMEKGVFNRMDVDMLVQAFMGMTNHLLCSSVSAEKSIDREEVESFIMALLEKGLITEKGRG
jgi:AcrR family transcriptional regulator